MSKKGSKNKKRNVNRQNKKEGRSKQTLNRRKRGWMIFDVKKALIIVLALSAIMGILFYVLKATTPYYIEYFKFYGMFVFSVFAIFLLSMCMIDLFQDVKETIRGQDYKSAKKGIYVFLNSILGLALIGAFIFYAGVFGKSILDVPYAVPLKPIVTKEKIVSIEEYKIGTRTIPVSRIKLNTENLRFNLRTTNKVKFLTDLNSPEGKVIEITYLPYTKTVLNINIK